MSDATVAAPTTTDDAPKGFISEKKILAVALKEAKKRGWCNEFKDVLKENFGIEVPERPKDVALRVTIDIPADALDYATGSDFWTSWDIENPDVLSTNDGDYGYGLTFTQYAALSAMRQLRSWATEGYGERERQALAAINGAKYELIRTEPTPAK